MDCLSIYNQISGGSFKTGLFSKPSSMKKTVFAFGSALWRLADDVINYGQGRDSVFH